MFGKLILKLFSNRKLDAGDRGFTLTELLVAMFVSTLIVSGLLAFLVNILQTDRREQVKGRYATRSPGCHGLHC
jgi:prepilin-type N-terminal cleavage/methylation domain-containing protein